MKKTFLSLAVCIFSLSISAQDIFRSTCNGDLDRLDSLLNHVSLNVEDHRGRSLLHWAVACRKKEIFDFLVKKGILINGEDHQNKTPMHIAVQFGNEEYFEYLVGIQRSKEWVDTYGASLLELAVLNRDSSFITKITESGVDIDQPNGRGSTALEIAQRIGTEAISDLLLRLGADPQKIRSFEMSGVYMGQEEPSTTPLVFAPNFISTEEYEFGSVFNSTGTEFYYGVDVNGKSEIRYTKLDGNTWSTPEVILSHDRYGYNDPFLSPDESRLYFISQRALDGKGDPKEDHDIWYVEKNPTGWSEPINPGPAINSSGNEYYISFTQKGTMYFSSNKLAPEERKQSDLDIYYSQVEEGVFQEAVSLGDSINTEAYEADVFVDPEEKYLIFCAMRSKGLGQGDLYISFKNEEGAWTKAMNMGAPINTIHHELCPFVTADGKYLFYTSNEDIYWVSTDIIKQLKEKSR